ncbi:MAG TPA: hypothetical protein VME22_31730 [Solirubrobacteraceae bacterium]|nr:hypothetical protein [Solirubrobacteraceae bacterium]
MRVGLTLGAAIATAMIAGCGGGSAGSGGTHVGSATLTLSATNSARTPAGASKPKADPSLLAFAECMRAHGVPDYPDPRPLGQLPTTRTTQPAPSGGFTANPNSPAYETASTDCRSLADASPVTQAAQGQMIAGQLKFAVCMRAHGVPSYPDPSATGEIGDDGAISGVDPSSPAVQSAERECLEFVPRPAVLLGGPGGSS